MNAASIAIGCLAIVTGTSSAAVFQKDGDLGSDLLLNEAAPGGNDWDLGGQEIFNGWEVRNVVNVGDEVSLEGIAMTFWANNTGPGGHTGNGTFTFTFYTLGANDRFDGVNNGETVLGTADVEFQSAGDGTGVYSATFDEAITFTADSTGFAFRIQSTNVIRMKRFGAAAPTSARQVRIDNGNRAGGEQYARFSFAGSIVPAPSAAAVLALAAGVAGRRRR